MSPVPFTYSVVGFTVKGQLVSTEHLQTCWWHWVYWKAGCDLIMLCVLRVVREYQDLPRVSCSLALLVCSESLLIAGRPSKAGWGQQFPSMFRWWCLLQSKSMDRYYFTRNRRWRTEANHSKAWIKEHWLILVNASWCCSDLCLTVLFTRIEECNMQCLDFLFGTKNSRMPRDIKNL